ncbi:MAG: hypothetical protein HXS44_15085 [Theionarchaea archaeon]|nr:hypothetical protein [Theionarchaea archaeon]
MIPIVVGVGIIVMLLGIIALFLPGLTRIINIPGNEKIKAIGAIITGIIIALLGYISD